MGGNRGKEETVLDLEHAGAAPDELDKDGSLEDMRIEWCKARARAKRWEEEVELLTEEMRRVLHLFKWEELRWDKRAKECAMESAVDREGCIMIAYAARQASLRRALSQSFSESACLTAKLDCPLSAADMEVD